MKLLQLALLFPFALTGYCQDLFEEGLRFENQFRVEEALLRYEQVLQKEPDHFEALVHASRMISYLAERLPDHGKDDKMKMIGKAKHYAERAINLRAADAQARLAFMISLGLFVENTRHAMEKVKTARQLYDEAVATLSLDSTFAAAYFILGKWQFELAQLSRMELMACKFFWGGLPEEISLQAAHRYFVKAVELENRSVLFVLGLAMVQKEMGNNYVATQLFHQALQKPMWEPNDNQRKEQCMQWLKQLDPSFKGK